MTRALDDPAAVRAEYADPSRLAARAAAWENSVGPDPRDELFAAVAEVVPRRVLEVGCGHGWFAERMLRELGAEVVAVDQSEQMVALTRARGVDAWVADVQDLPFDDGSFDCTVAAWMLYHVPDLDRAVAELARVLRPGGRLVAVTNPVLNLPELWALFDDEAPPRAQSFHAGNGAAILGRSFTRVETREVRGTLVFPDREAARSYVAASITRPHLAERLPGWDGPLECTRMNAVFVAVTAEPPVREADQWRGPGGTGRLPRER